MVGIIGYCVWAKGKDETEAKRNFKRHGGKLSDGYVLLTFAEGVIFEGVDDLGRYHYRSEDGSQPAAPTEQVIGGARVG